MEFKWKINGNDLIIHNKKTGEIVIIDEKSINKFKKSMDNAVRDFIDKK